MSEIYLGTSGWSYREWEKVFYPAQEKRKLTYYSSVFRTVEIDSTFYAYPKEGVVHGWARNTPSDFVFSAKLPKLITHDKRLESGVLKDVFRFLDVMKPLLDMGKLGPVLVQLPPSFSFENGYERLRRFVGELPNDVTFAVEFRHTSWLRKEEVRRLLTENRVASTVVDEPLLPVETTPTSDVAVVRWHGHGKRPWYNYRYSDEELKAWKPRLQEISSKAKKVYGYFNNHFHGFAVENCLKTLGIMGAATHEQERILRQVTDRLDSRGRGLLEFVAGRE